MAEEIDYSKPFKIRVLQDCREPAEYGPAGKLDGAYGVCLGRYEHPSIWKKTNHDNGYPLICTLSGDYIWGIECWWDSHPDEHEGIPLDLQQRVLELHKEVLRKKMGVEVDSLN